MTDPALAAGPDLLADTAATRVLLSLGRDGPFRTAAFGDLAWLCPGCGLAVPAGQPAWLLPDGRYRCGPCTRGA